ncbi:MAG: 50S ribosomal protein L32 [Magnetococcales bacterium]|nr:50S ribosomal protein L32 [Magnetococcales bacterium]
MAVPKKKISHSRGGKRRSHNALVLPNLSTCTNCQAPVMPHQVCGKCGWYRGREVIKIEE